MKKRVFYFDLLNILACICVVALHCNGIVHTFSADRCWKTSLIVETAAYWAVPVFFMISGATLMDYRERYSTKDFLVKRFVKTFLPFVIWSMILLSLELYYGDIHGSDLSVQRIISMLFNSEIVGIYWFFPALFTVYLAIPVLSAVPKERRNKIFSYALVYAICFISVLPLLCDLAGITFNGAFEPGIAGGYLLFALLGYQLTQTVLSAKMRAGIYVCGVAGWLLRFLSTLLVSPKIGDVYEVFWGYLRLPSVMLAVAVFVWFQYHDFRRLEKRCGKIVRTLAGASFGVYLIHWILVWRVPIHFGFATSCWEWRTLGIFAVYLISLAVVLVMKKIPILKYLVP